jgi:GrpB-like predicted nucleotidyltransferase (UPF0157 family)
LVAIEVVDYDERWPVIAAAACVELHESLAGSLTEIEHVGSTSVLGLAAKPIIDLMAATPDLARVTGREDVLRELGYLRVETEMRGRLFYRRDRDGQVFHLHVVPAGTWADRNERLLRDHLRGHPADAARYADLKRDLAARHDGADSYTKAKTDLIQQLTDRARADRGLPSVPVWEG